MAYTSPYEVGSTEWLEAMDYPEQYRSEVKTYRAMALKQGIVKKPVDPTVPQDRKAALDAIEREFGEWTYFDAITVIAGGKKHRVPAGTVSESGPLRGRRRVRPVFCIVCHASIALCRSNRRRVIGSGGVGVRIGER